MKSPGGGKALLFEKPTVNGVVSPLPVAINTHGHEHGRGVRGKDKLTFYAERLQSGV
jgi:hypothetical protein